jgi:hypothetical protein
LFEIASSWTRIKEASAGIISMSHGLIFGSGTIVATDNGNS